VREQALPSGLQAIVHQTQLQTPTPTQTQAPSKGWMSGSDPRREGVAAGD
jgi:hypothetical protein